MGSRKNYGQKEQGRNGSKKPLSAKFMESKKLDVNRYHVFQLHGCRNKQSMTYSKVFEHLILKIQGTFKSPNVILKILRDKAKGGPSEPTRTWVVIPAGATADETDKLKFDQETNDIKFKSKWDE